MNTRKHILVGILLFLTMFSSTVSAQAGLLDWFKSSTAKADTAESGSFDQLYASALYTAPMTNDAQVVSGNAIVPATSPSKHVQTVSHRTYIVDVSGYNSEVGQTDDSPFITASGTHVRDGIVATNMFPFGTILKMPSLYGDKIFVVEDRMNTRYQRNVDIWFADKSVALKLGRRTVQIEVIK